MSDTIAAFEALVDKLIRPDAELTQAEIIDRAHVEAVVCRMHQVVVDGMIARAKKRGMERE